MIPEEGAEPSSFSLFACHPRLAQAHDGRYALHNHPWLRFAKGHSLPGTDHDIRETAPNDAVALELARDCGFRSALIIPTSAGSDLGRVEMLCLGSVHADTFAGPNARLIRALARSLAAELHDWLAQHLRENLRDGARLQDEDLRLLELEWQGLGTKEIAARTGLSLAAVDSRFQRINVRLNCTSRRSSARRVAAYGLLETSRANGFLL